MSKLNIQKNEWLELVFDGKNKNYGAYVLRQENGNTTLKAFFSGLIAIALLFGIGLILSSFTKKETILKPTELPETLTVTAVTIKKEKVELPKTKKTTVNKKQPEAKQLTKIKPVEATQAPKVTVISNLNLSSQPNANANGTLAVTSSNPENGNGIVENIESKEPTGPVPTAILDKIPQFPGGIAEFTKTVGRKFISPELDEQRIIRVLVFFVIEKDGSLSNITVPRDPGFGIGSEAIRVLKTIKTKWEPGILNGKPVRTNFSLPIVVKTE